MLRYRNTEYYYKEWTTWNGKLACGYTCQDKDLLQHTNVVSFGARSDAEMKLKIDNYLDNVDHYKELQRLHDEGCAAYYAEKRASGDNYTGD
jgi:hypothetical protein